MAILHYRVSQIHNKEKKQLQDQIRIRMPCKPKPLKPVCWDENIIRVVPDAPEDWY